MITIIFMFNDYKSYDKTGRCVRDVFDSSRMPSLRGITDDGIFKIEAFTTNPDKIEEIKENIKRFDLEKYGTLVIL